MSSIVAATETITKDQVESVEQIARQWNVMLWNDDVHTFPFVVGLIQKVFKTDINTAGRYTLQIHELGLAVVATCSRADAERFQEQVHSIHEWQGNQNIGPLDCTIEQDG